MTITPFKRRDVIALSIILIIAALMRFWRAGIVEYFHDDGMLATLAQEMATGQAFHLTGILSSTGIPNPPTSVYALLPFFWISRDPVFAIYGIMALNVIGVGLLWMIAHRYFGRWTAVVAGLLYAANPWTVLYSRKLWAQDYHTPFFLLGLLLALYGFTENEGRPTLRSARFWAQVASLPILLFAMQIHFAAWALFPVYVIVLWIGRKRIAWKALALSAVFSTIVLLPYLIGLTQTLQHDPTRISDAANRTQERPGGLTLEPLLYPIHFITFGQLETWLDPNHNTNLQQRLGTTGWQTVVMVALAFAAGVWSVFKSRRTHLLWLLWWSLGPSLLLMSNLTAFYPHYLIASIPAMILVFSLGIAAYFNPFFSTPNLRWIAGIVAFNVFLVFSLGYGLGWTRDILDSLDAHHIPYPGFTTPLHYLIDIRDALKDETDVVVLSDGMAWDLNHEVGVWDTLLYDKRCVRTLRGDGYAVLPDHPFAVLVASNAPAGGVQDFYSVGTPQIFPEREGGGVYKIYHWDKVPEWPALKPTYIPPTRFANGVELIGYDLRAPRVTLAWHLPQGQRGENVQYTVQFFDAEGNRVGQGDKVFWQSQHWCAGDTLLTWLDIPRDGEVKTFRVGLYSLLGEGQYRPIPAVDATGQPIGDTVEFVP